MTQQRKKNINSPGDRRVREVPFKKLILFMVLLGTIPFSFMMHYFHYILLFLGTFLVLQALVTRNPERISRYISTFLLLTLASFIHVAVLGNFDTVGSAPAFIAGFMNDLHSAGGREFLVKTGLFIGLFLVAHTALVRYAMYLTGTSTGLFLGRRVPDTGTGIIRERGKGIILQKEMIGRRRKFLRVGHYFSESGNIGMQIYRSYLAILFIILLLFLGIIIFNPVSGMEFLYRYSRIILYMVIGMVPFTLVVIATVLLSLRLSIRHAASVY